VSGSKTKKAIPGRGGGKTTTVPGKKTEFLSALEGENNVGGKLKIVPKTGVWGKKKVKSHRGESEKSFSPRPGRPTGSQFCT